MKIIVYHCSFELAEKAGLASHSDRIQHMFPYVDATCSFAKRHIEAVSLLWLANCYEKVAEIQGSDLEGHYLEDLEYAFEKTNHIDQAWNRPGVHDVTPVRNSNNRSSSVGDIFEVIDDNNVSKLYRVASCGFEPFEEYTKDQLRIMAEHAGHFG